MDNIFTKRLLKDDQKEETFKRLENIKDTHLVQSIKLKVRVILIMTLNTHFTNKLHRVFKILKKRH